MKIFKELWKSISSRVWLIVTASFLVVLLVANLVVTQSGFVYNTVNSIFGSERQVHVSGDASQYTYYKSDYDTKDKTLAAANALNEKIVEEGITLLKNEDNALPIRTPLSPTKAGKNPRVSVFGKNSVNLVYGGSGSAGASTSGAATIFSSLTDSGYDVNPTLKSFYDSKASGSGRPKSPSMGDMLGGFAIGETPKGSYTADVKSSYAEYNDAALIVFSRIGGEGYDLPRTMSTTIGGTTKIDGARSTSDHYLQLDQNETDLIAEVSKSFDKIIIIINSSQAMELGFLTDPTHYAYSANIKGALWVGGTGKTGINALGRVMNGTVNPSGRTIDTYASDFKNDPSWANFGNNNVNDGNRYKVNDKNRSYYYVEYEEGIYVGYRYYETRGFTEQKAGNAGWYNKNVTFPFGFGLSYTDFAWEITNTSDIEAQVIDAKSEVVVKVKVSNTGAVAGKEVVQLYVTAPYTAGEIEKSHVVLAGFEKTPLLYPLGETTDGKPNSCEVEIKVPAYYLASYDYNDANVNQFKGYEIEAGNYELKVSNDSHTVADTAVIKVAANIKIEQDTTTETTVVNRFDDVSEYVAKYLSRSDWAGTWPVAPTSSERNVSAEFINSLTYDNNDSGKKWEATTMPKQSKNAKSYNATKIKLYDMIGKDFDDPMWDEMMDQLSVNQLRELIGQGNYHTKQIPNIDKPMTMDLDGPVGFTTLMGDPNVYNTCFYASGCVIGATFNKELAEDMGIMIGNEGIIGNERGDKTTYSGWYAPAVNIHRSPFSGRNWEYFSEDSFLSGAMASSTVKGAKSKGVYTYVKHFALNDQETDRVSNGILTWANEQSMREIYLRAFEITVKEGKTSAMMSSFNRIGKTWAGGSYELLTEVLRNEWGFRGMVITDYNLYPHMPADQMIRAGGDLNLSQEKLPSKGKSATQVTAIRNAGKNILYTVANSNAMNRHGPNVIYKYIPPVWVMWMIVADAAVVVGFGTWGFFVIRKFCKKRKNANNTIKGNS